MCASKIVINRRMCAVRNLPYDITEEEVRKHFEPAGVPNRIACAPTLHLCHCHQLVCNHC